MSTVDYNKARAEKRPTSGSDVIDRLRHRALPATSSPQSASAETPEDYRLSILSQARTQARNDGLLKEIEILYSTYAVGQGLKLQLSGGSPAWRKQALDLWEDFCECPEITRRFTMPELQTFACNALSDDGDFFVVLIYDQEKKSRPWLQILESHQVGGSGDFEHGVIKDPVTKQPTHYIVRDENGEEQKYPASSIIHIANFTRYSSDRGTPDFETSIVGTYARSELSRLIMTKAQADAEKIHIIITPDIARTNQIGELATETLEYDEREIKELEAEIQNANRQTATELSNMTGGHAMVLNAGQDYKEAGNPTPGATYDAYMNHLMNMDSLGLINYSFIHPEKLGGASLRAMLAQTDAKIVIRRQMPLIRAWKKIARWFLAVCMDRGLLPFVDDFHRVDYQTPARITADYGRDAKADRDDLQAGITSLTDNFEARGLDFPTELDHKIAEVKLIRETCQKAGINPALIFPLIFKDAAAPATTSPQPPAPAAV